MTKDLEDIRIKEERMRYLHRELSNMNANLMKWNDILLSLKHRHSSLISLRDSDFKAFSEECERCDNCKIIKNEVIISNLSLDKVLKRMENAERVIYSFLKKRKDIIDEICYTEQLLIDAQLSIFKAKIASKEQIFEKWEKYFATLQKESNISKSELETIKNIAKSDIVIAEHLKILHELVSVYERRLIMIKTIGSLEQELFNLRRRELFLLYEFEVNPNGFISEEERCQEIQLKIKEGDIIQVDDMSLDVVQHSITGIRSALSNVEVSIDRILNQEAELIEKEKHFAEAEEIKVIKELLMKKEKYLDVLKARCYVLEEMSADEFEIENKRCRTNYNEDVENMALNHVEGWIVKTEEEIIMIKERILVLTGLRSQKVKKEEETREVERGNSLAAQIEEEKELLAEWKEYLDAVKARHSTLEEMSADNLKKENERCKNNYDGDIKNMGLDDAKKWIMKAKEEIIIIQENIKLLVASVNEVCRKITVEKEQKVNNAKVRKSELREYNTSEVLQQAIKEKRLEVMPARLMPAKKEAEKIRDRQELKGLKKLFPQGSPLVQRRERLLGINLPFPVTEVEMKTDGVVISSETGSIKELAHTRQLKKEENEKDIREQVPNLDSVVPQNVDQVVSSIQGRRGSI